MYDNMIEFIVLNDDEQELWEIDYEKKIALNISDLGIIKNKVSNYTGTIEDFLKEKGSAKYIFTIIVHFPRVLIIKVHEIVHLDESAEHDLQYFSLS